MRRFKRGLAVLLVVLMVTAALPTAALAEKPGRAYDDEVTYNTGSMEITVGYDQATADAGEMPYVLFDEDGSYTIELYEPDVFFPYEVQFTYQGRTTTEWFLDEDDSVAIGGHTFYIDSYYDPSYIGVWVGGEYIAAYPEEKEFTNDYGISLMSMLPLEEKTVYLDMTGYLPDELKAVSIETIINGLKTSSGQQENVSSDVAVWAKWDYYDEDGNYVSQNDNYIVIGEGSTIDLSSYSSYSSTIYLELIIGTADQLDASNVRYNVRVSVSDYGDLLSFTAYNEDRDEIDVYNTYLWQSGNDGNIYQIGVDKNDWTSGEKAYLGMELSDEFFGLTATVYEGYYEEESKIPTNAVEITDQIWNQSNIESTGGYLADYSYQNRYEGMPEVTVVLKRDGNTAMVLPMILYIYENGIRLHESPSLYANREGYSYRTNVSNTYTMDYTNGYTYATIALKDGYDANDTYYFNLSLYNPADTASAYGLEYVKKAVVGYFSNASDIPEDAVDIKDQLFSNSYTDGGYGADYSDGVTFTIIDVNNDIYWFGLKTIVYEEGELPDVPTPLSADTYFRMQSAKNSSGSSYSYWVMPYDTDSYYYNGFQTVFLLNNDSTAVMDDAIVPVFWTGSKVTAYAGHDSAAGEKQISGETSVNFESGKAIQYSAAAENGTHLKNYWVTFITQQSGAKLFVNGINDESRKEDAEAEGVDGVREVFLTEDYGYHHDIFFANIGDEELTGLSVTLTDAQNIALDEYWTIGESSTAKLAAFNTTDKKDSNGSYISYGELPNVAKIRLVPVYDENGNIMAGEISGTLTISSDNGGSVSLKLTGTAATPKIITTELVDGVKYVPYSCVIQTNNMYGSDAVVFELVEGTLPSGMILKQNGELYGVPQAAGTFTFTVQMSYNGAVADTAEFTLIILDNTDINVWEATDSNYEVVEYVGDETNNEGHFLLEDYQDELFWTSGSYGYFIDFWLDGKKLTDGKDYFSEEGSTKITIYAQTLQNAGTGTHTIAAEFREGDPETGTLKRAAQNYTIESSSVTPGDPGYTGRPSEGNSSNSSNSTNNTTNNTANNNNTTIPTDTKPSEQVWPFIDVTLPDWFYGDVKWAYENSYMVGVSDTLFAPKDPINQAIIVTVLARMANIDLSQFEEVSYDSITPNQWYTNAAIWAKQAGMLPDYTDFVEVGGLSRGQMAIMLVKYLRSMGMDTSLPEVLVTFDDADLMTQEENDAFQVLYHYGIFRGVGGYCMNVAGTTSRAEFSALIHRVSVFIEGQK